MSNELMVLENVRKRMEIIPGHTGFYYLNLITGTEYGVREDEIFGAASVIKLPLYMHVLAECAAGRMAMDEILTITAEDKVPICGALTLFTGDVQVDVRTLCKLMISISDNTATNKLLTFCGFEETNAAFRKMGLQKTVINRLLFDYEAAKRGFQNYICPREIGMLLERLYRREFVSPEVSQYAIDILLDQQVDHKLNGKLCGEVPIAHKTGEDDRLSNDVGIVFAKEPFVPVVTDTCP